MIETAKFSLKLFAGLFVALALHLLAHSILEYPLTGFMILESYLTNFLLVVISYYVIVFFRERKSKSLAIIYLGGFFLKIAFFMLLFKPIYKADGVIDPSEFLAFFIPYSLCLIFETTVIVKILNKS